MTARLLILFSTVIVLIFNLLSNLLPFNGVSTAAVSDSFDVFFVPAGYVFSIWGVIYILLISFTIYAFLPQNIGNGRLAKIAPWYMLSSLANSAWLLSWHYQQFGLSVAIMLVLLFVLIRIYLMTRGAVSSRAEFWMHSIPFSVYLGWISVATIANITAYLDYANWDGFGLSESAWCSIMIVIAGLLGILFALKRKDVAYALVILWAIGGIWLNFPLQTDIVTTVKLISTLLVAAIIYTLSKPKLDDAATY